MVITMMAIFAGVKDVNGSSVWTVSARTRARMRW